MSDFAIRDAERKLKTEKRKTEGFQSFLEQPLTQVSLARMPATENNEIVELLRASYQSGFNVGQGDVLEEVITSLFKGNARDEKRPY